MKFLKPLTVLTVTFCITTTALLAQPKETPWTESGVRELAKNATESEIVMNCLVTAVKLKKSSPIGC